MNEYMFHENDKKPISKETKKILLLEVPYDIMKEYFEKERKKNG